MLAVLATGCGGDNGGDDAPDTGTVADTTRQPSNDAAVIDSGSTPDAAGEDAETPDTSTSDLPVADVEQTDGGGEGPCIGLRANARAAVLPVDIIWIIDNSSSMVEEIGIIEENINAFAEFIRVSGIDYRVVVIAAEEDITSPNPFGGGELISYYGVCVPPPLSDAFGCPDTDSGVYQHVRTTVDSTNALEVFTTTYPSFRDFLRPEAVTHIIVVSDDESAMSAGTFLSTLDGLGGPISGREDVIIHSIVAQSDNVGACLFPPCPPDQCGASEGRTYISLAAQTGGVNNSVCLSDWSPIFDAIGENVIEGTQLPCRYFVPEPDNNTIEVDPDETNIYFVDGDGERTLVPNVNGVNDCNGGRGWYFDNPASPTFISLCPDTCGQVEGEIEFEFGCRTIKG